MDKLEMMFQLQDVQQRNWNDIPAMTDVQKDNFLRDLVLLTVGELLEFMDARRFKRHKIWESSFPRDTQVMELVDVQKYLLTMALVLDVSSKEWFDMFQEKTEIVQERWVHDQAKWETSNQKVVVCDIDDVLADYQNVIDRFGYTKNQMEEDGHYRRLAPIQENIDALKQLEQIGYHIVLMTTRRVWRVSSIQSDTVSWLRYYQVPYEAILYGYDKAEKITTRLKNVKPAFAVENSRKHAIDIADMGTKVYLIKDKFDYPNIVSVRSLQEIEELAVHV